MKLVGRNYFSDEKKSYYEDCKNNSKLYWKDIIELRKKGFTYLEISEKLNFPVGFIMSKEQEFKDSWENSKNEKLEAFMYENCIKPETNKFITIRKNLIERKKELDFFSYINEDKLKTIKKKFYPAFELFNDYIEKGNIKCELFPEKSKLNKFINLANSISIRIICKAFVYKNYYVDIKMNFSLIYYPYSLEKQNHEEVIEFFQEYLDEKSINENNFDNDLNYFIRNKVKKTERYKFNDINPEMILEKLFIWLNKLIKNGALDYVDEDSI